MRGMNPLAKMAAERPAKYARGKVPALIDGIVRGPGGPTEDKVDAKVSPKEAILPARTVQAIGGPAAIRALIERTNDGQAPESEVRGGGKYADGAVPGFFDDFHNAMASGAPIKQDLANLSQLASDTVAQARKPVDAFVSGVQNSVQQIGNASRQAMGDFSQKSRLMPDVPAADSATYAAQPKPANPLAVSPPVTPPQRPVTPLAQAAKPSPLASPASAPASAPSVNTQIGDTAPNPLVSGVSTIGTNGYLQQAANIRALSADAGRSDRSGPPVGMSWDAEERQRKRDFDNFSARSNLEGALYNARRSGRSDAIQATGNALTNFNAQADGQWNKSQEFGNSLKALAAKTAADMDSEDNRSQNRLAELSLTGQNGLAQEALRGRNMLDQEVQRGVNARTLNPLAAEAQRLTNQINQTKLADMATLQTLQTRMMAETDPGKRQEMADEIMALQGREPANRYSTNIVHGVKTKDNQGNETVSNPISLTTDLRTGQTMARPLARQPNTVTVGGIVNGYRFKGGDPNLGGSWEKVR